MMFTEEPNRWDRVFFAIVTISVFGALAWARMAGSDRSSPDRTPASATTASFDNPIHVSPTVPTVVDEPRPPRVQERVVARVFECSHNGQRVLSDQPCGPGAKVRSIQEPNRMVAQDTRNLYERRTSPAYQPRPSSSSRPMRSDAATAARCAAIEREIDQINASLRTGYKRAEYRRQRLRDLSAEKWDIKCRFLNTPPRLRD